MLDPLINTIEVPCSQERAFNIFLNDMESWWPLDERSMSLMQEGHPAKGLKVTAAPGGKIIEIGHGGDEYHWGTITEHSPFERLVMDFHMGLPAENASRVAVEFTALEGDRTKVVLTHDNWEAFGDMAEMMRGGYDSGWVLIFKEGFASACAK
jgi:activator of Hsp90 ATPase-like protein